MLVLDLPAPSAMLLAVAHAARSTPRRAWLATALPVWLLVSLGACGAERAPGVVPAAPFDGGTSGGVGRVDAGDAASAAPGSPGEAGEAARPIGANGVALDDVLGQRALALLERRCSTCHAGATGAGPLGPLTHVSDLIGRGLIVPGEGATAPLLAGTRPGHGGEHPALALMTAGEVALLRRFIDELAVAPEPCTALPFVSLDQALAVMLADVAGLGAEDRRFARYATLTHASNAGACGAALERERRALFAAVNGASLGPEPVPPQAVDAAGLVYRIDLRDHRWQRALDLDGDGATESVDGWSAIVAAAGAYASEHAGPDAAALAAATAAPVPFLGAHVLVRAVASGELYPALIDVPRGLGFDPSATLDASSSLRFAGFISRGREAEVTWGAPLAGRPAWSIADSPEGDSESPFSNPSGLFDGERRYILSLPNGLLAYVAEGQEGERRAEAGHHEVCRGSAGCSATLPLAACSACHDQGLLPIADEVRAVVLRDAELRAAPELEQILALHPPQAELDARLAADNQLQREARARLFAPAPGPDPLSSVYVAFELALGPERAAAELGVPLEALRASLSRLDERLAPLGDAAGSVERAVFTELFAGARCALLAGARHRPAGCGSDAGAPAQP